MLAIRSTQTTKRDLGAAVIAIVTAPLMAVLDATGAP